MGVSGIVERLLYKVGMNGGVDMSVRDSWPRILYLQAVLYTLQVGP